MFCNHCKKKMLFTYFEITCYKIPEKLTTQLVDKATAGTHVEKKNLCRRFYLITIFISALVATKCKRCKKITDENASLLSEKPSGAH